MSAPITHRRTVLVVVSAAVALVLAACGAQGANEEDRVVTVGQPVPTLGYLPLDVARVLDTFSDHGRELDWTLLSGADPAILAALEAGDLDFGAPGTLAALQAISEGQDLQIIYATMSQMSLDLTVSNEFMERSNVTAADPLEEKLAAIDGLTVGVAGLGGAQDLVSRWLGEYAGHSPGAVSTVNVGSPPALRAAVEEGQVDGYVLTAPNGPIAEHEGFGARLIRLGTEIPELEEFYHTVVAINPEFGEENPELVTDTVAALIDGAERAMNDTDEIAEELWQAEYEELPERIVTDSVESLLGGVDNQGRITVDGMDSVIEFAEATDPLAEPLDAAEGEGEWWTNAYIERAQDR